MRRILKANEVTFGDPLLLGCEATAASGVTETPCATAQPSVRLAQSHAEYAVLEVTCACGKTTYIRCEYASTSA